MNIVNRLKKLETKAASSDAFDCKASVYFQRVTLGEQRKIDSTPGNCQRCGKPMGENVVKIIVPVKLSPEQWTKQWKANNT